MEEAEHSYDLDTVVLWGPTPNDNFILNPEGFQTLNIANNIGIPEQERKLMEGVLAISHYMRCLFSAE